jgi:Capsule polysaccharide biosynthesis protein
LKIVIFDPNSTMIPHVGVMIDEALVAQEEGHDVTFITCGGCLDSCYSNPLKTALFCKICVRDYKEDLAKILGDKVRHRTLNDYSSEELDKIISEYDYSFESTQELKKKTFRGIDIGYATLSAFISNTRNLNPILSPFTKSILVKMLKSAVRMSLLSEVIFEKEKPDKILLYNGRMPESRPLLRYFRNKNIDVNILEVYPTNLTGGFKKISYENDLPHSIRFIQKRMQEEWMKNPVQGEEFARGFFSNRRSASFAGDKVYVKDQKSGLLPDKWNSSRRNIVIFNSSEDEFSAIGTEWEDKLFESQLKGIDYIFRCVEKYPEAEVYLRVHPNLKDIKFKYHTDLYRLYGHPRVHVIPGSSKISTYALVDAADVVVSFGTSVGVEAAYSGKPVVLLGSSFYKDLGFCYEPKSIAEMENQIFSQQLTPLYNDNILKYGNYIMCDKGKDFVYYNFNCTQFQIGRFRTPNVAMIDQSKRSLGKIKSFFMRLWREMQRQYLKIRIKEA